MKITTEQGRETLERLDGQIQFRHDWDFLRALAQEGLDSREKIIHLRKRIHASEQHNQFFERCESAYCNPVPTLACCERGVADPAQLPHGDRFAHTELGKVSARILELEQARDAAEARCRELEVDLKSQQRDIKGLNRAITKCHSVGCEHCNRSAATAAKEKA